MHVGELYARARNTSNLRSTAHTRASASDVLGAAGMAGQRHATAMLLWGVTYKGRTEDVHKLIEAMASMLRSGYKRDRRQIKGRYIRVATEVLAWHLHGVCTHCSGRGYEAIEGTPMLSDMLCQACGGTGKIKLPRSDDHRWLADQIAELQAVAAGEVMRKLAPKLEL